MDKPKPIIEPTPPGTPMPADQPSIPLYYIESKRAELVDARHQLELQLNGVINQIHLIDQLIKPIPPPAPDNTI